MNEQPTMTLVDPTLIVGMISPQLIEYIYVDDTNIVVQTIIAACSVVEKEVLRAMFGRLEAYDRIYKTRLSAECAHILCNHSSDFHMALREERHFQLFRKEKWMYQCQWREFALEPNKLFACQLHPVAVPEAYHRTIGHISAA